MSKDPHIANIFSAEEEDCLSLEQMAAYQQGQLAGQGKHLVERHLLNCELCALTYESLAENSVESLTAGAAEVSDRAWDRLAAGERRKRRGAIFWVASAASIALLVTVGYITMRGPSDLDSAKAFTKAMEQTPPRNVPNEAQGDKIAMEYKQPETSVRESAAPITEPNDASGGDLLAGTPKTKSVEADNMWHEDQRRFQNAPDHAESKGMGGVAAHPAKDATVATMNGATGEKNGIAATGITNVKEAAPMPVPSIQKTDARQLTYDFDLAETEHMDDFKSRDEGGATFDRNLEDGIAGDDANETRVIGRATMTDQEIATVNAGKMVKAESMDKVAKSKKSPATTREAQMAGVAEEPTAPAAPARNYDQGILSYKEGNYREAAKEFRKATEQTPSNLEAHIYAADAFLRISQPQAALYHIERVLAVPGNSHIEDAEWYKALALLQLKEGVKAEQQLEKVIARGNKYKAAAESALDELK
jgi:hypothetical protein